MQRQAVPLIRPMLHLLELVWRVVQLRTLASYLRRAGEVTEADAAHVAIYSDEYGSQRYDLPGHERSNQSTCINHRPTLPWVRRSRASQLQMVHLLTTPELALGATLTVAYMPWEGYNYEDGIIVSESVVQGKIFLTSVNISAMRLMLVTPSLVLRRLPERFQTW